MRERRQRFVIIFKTLEGKPRPTEPTLHTSVDPDSLLKCTVHIHAADDLLLLVHSLSLRATKQTTKIADARHIVEQPQTK